MLMVSIYRIVDVDSVDILGCEHRWHVLQVLFESTIVDTNAVEVNRCELV
jgi:hypothetical protein